MAHRRPASSWCSKANPVPLPVVGLQVLTVSARPPVRWTIGTVPIVHRTGGLADTVQTWSPSTGRGTGFAFEHHDEAGLRWAIQAALATYRQPAQWSQIVQNGMAADFSWQTQGRLYELVYKRLASS